MTSMPSSSVVFSRACFSSNDFSTVSVMNIPATETAMSVADIAMRCLGGNDKKERRRLFFGVGVADISIYLCARSPITRLIVTFVF